VITDGPALYLTEIQLITSNNTRSPHGVNDSLKVSFNASDYSEVDFEVLGDVIHRDSTFVYFGASTNGSWISGNVCMFDAIPSTAALDGWPAAYGAAADSVGVPNFGYVISPVNSYGARLHAPYINILVVSTSPTHTNRWKNLSIWAICKR
jgi:hypothetical protein